MVVSCRFCMQACVCVYSLNNDSDHNNKPIMLHNWCHVTQAVDHKSPFALQVVTACGFGFVTVINTERASCG